MWYSAIAFVHPWILSALVILPAIWWLLRAIPPTPRLERFPAIRLLQGLPETTQSPQHTPWWLLALRLMIAALIIIGLARPLLDPSTQLPGGGLLIIAVDDGWAAGPQWEARRDSMENLLEQAERNGRQVLLLTTAREEAAAQPPNIQSAAAARAAVAGLQPKPWRLDRMASVKRLAAVPIPDMLAGNTASVWLNDGLVALEDEAGAAALMETLRQLGPVTLMQDPPEKDVIALLQPRALEDGFELEVVRPRAGAPRTGELHALGEDGNILAAAAVNFPASETSTVVQLSLPAGIRNAVTQIRIAGIHSPASVWLLDDRWKRRSVGIVSGAGSEAAQPLLDDAFYLERAMAPFADIRKGTIASLLASPLSMLVLADIGRIVGNDRLLAEEWLKKGGLLVRFAGPRMIEQSDDLIPVQLRQGGRELGGALSWEVPARLAPFPENSPFFNLPVPDDVTVSRQILAQPGPSLIDKTWAGLEDGTPLVTAGRLGKGWNVLFHVTANMRWSNLPASGLYVAMLQQLTMLAQGAAGINDGINSPQTPLGALVMLDGQGQLRSPLHNVKPYVAADAAPDIGPHLPPGYYGADNFRVALNLNRDANDLRPLADFSGVKYSDYTPASETDAGPWLLFAALVLWMIDSVIALSLLGHLPQWAGRWSGPAAALSIAVLIAFPTGAFAQQAQAVQEPAPEAALATRLAYVITGDAAIDAMSAAGLNGLSRILRERTAFEAAVPMGVNPENDELVFFPLLYWPMTVNQQMLSQKALSLIDAYMKNGGTIFFDTRDHLTDFNLGGNGAGEPGPGLAVLRQILQSLDIPPLAPVAEDHVLTRSYYLLREFPGRYAGGQLWVAAAADGAQTGRAGDGVSSIVIGANDWASAWAVDEGGTPLLPVEPGGESQRERAYRTGVNLVMYSLTGNYKNDQVHVPVLLERLGQ
jgi:Domain of unknown function (DUF4159)/Aerotolerance regulator N-terminal